MMMPNACMGIGLLKLLIVVAVWELVWKGWALWIAARKESKPWFVFLLILNTVGILPILYIFFFSKTKTSQQRKRRR